MKTLVFSDLHLDAVTAGRARREEVSAYLLDAVDHIRREKIELVLFAGDLQDPGGLFEAFHSALFTRYVLQILQAGARVVGIPGNHDVIDSSELFLQQPISTLTPLRALEGFRDVEKLFANLHVRERPQLVDLGNGWGVLALPHVSRAHAQSVEGWYREAFERAKVFRRQSFGRLIVLAHLTIPGARMGSESVEMAKGRDQLFPFEDVLALQPSLVINGHYHGRQVVLADNGLEIQIPGAPLRFTFGEVEDREKGFFVAEFPS